MKTAKFVNQIIVIDPDTQGEVELEVYKHENGGMFAMDASFIDQCIDSDDYDRTIIPDPFSDNGVEKGEIDHVVLFE